MGGGVFWKVKTQSSKICLNFNFQGEGVLTALFTKLPDGLPPYRMGSGGRSVWQFPIDIFPFFRERPVTKELAALWIGLLKVKTQSAKICLNFNFQGVLENQNPKCQDLPKFQFLGGGSGKSKLKTQSSKICLNFNLGGSEKSKPKVPRSA